MDGIAARRFTLAGKRIAAGKPVSLPDAQFAELARLGLVEIPPAKAKPTRPTRKRGSPEIAAPRQ